MSLPAERAEAKSLSSPSGNLRVARTSMISFPTAPVTPTTPTLTGFSAMFTCAGARIGCAAAAATAGWCSARLWARGRADSTYASDGAAAHASSTSAARLRMARS